jgi:Uma2 family endonuclease
MRLAPGSKVTIEGVSWDEFESILQELGEKRSLRVAYSNSTLEIIVPLPEHEKPKGIISDIVKILLKKTGKKYEPFGSTTFKQENIAGIEPDACFYIQNYQKMIGRRRIQPGDPPPDLAIEIDVTSPTTLDAYMAMGYAPPSLRDATRTVIATPELWVYNDNLTIYLFNNVSYIKSDNSPTFLNIPLLEIIPNTVERAWQVGTVQALEELENEIHKIYF